MQQGRDTHLSDDDLERYSLNALPEPRLAEAEEHLLVCPECRERVEETDAYVAGMRAAAARFRRREARFPIWSFPRPVWAMAACAAALVVAGVTMRPPGAAPEPVAVRLEAARGHMAVHAAAPAGRPLELAMDLTELPAHPGYRIEVVDERGRRVWDGTASVRGGRLAAAVPARFPRGRYYVRLYSPSSELLREYGLETR